MTGYLAIPKAGQPLSTRRIGPILGLLAVLLSLATRGLAQPAAASKWPWLEIKVLQTEADVKEIRALQQKVKRIVRGDDALDADARQNLDLFFNQYLLPQFTQEKLPPEKQQGGLPGLRDEILGYLRVGTQRNNAEAIELVNDHVFNFMMKVARGTIRIVGQNGAGMDVPWNGLKGTGARYYRLNMQEIPAHRVAQVQLPQQNFSPASRFNAMLMIGDLNTKMEIRHRDRVTIPVEPYHRCLQPMTDVANDPSYPDNVRVAALKGIMRHVVDAAHGEQGDLGDNVKTPLVTEMLRIAKRADDHFWIRRQAIEILGACRMEGANQEVFKWLNELMIDREALLSLRLAAAEALGMIPRKQAKRESIILLAKQMAGLAVDVARYELANSLDRQPPMSRPRAAAGFGAVLKGLGGDVTAEHGAAARGKLGGLHALATPKDQPYIKSLIEKISPVRDACGSRDADDAAIKTILKDNVVEINSFLTGQEADAATVEKSGEEGKAPMGMTPAVGKPAMGTPAGTTPASDPFGK